MGEPGQAFGIDIGGTGIKGAVVDISTGPSRDAAQAASSPRTRPRRTPSPTSSPSW